MKEKKTLVSIATTNTTSSEFSAALNSPLSRASSATAKKSPRVVWTGRAAGSGVLLVNLGRLLVPFLVLISTQCCTTTTSLSPLGLYKVGIGATNLVENILGNNGSVKSKTLTSTEHQSKIVHKNEHRRNKKNNKGNRNNKTKTAVTNKRKRQEKNKNSVKRSNSDNKKRNTREKSTISNQHTNKTNTEVFKKGNTVGNITEISKSDKEKAEDKDMLRIQGLSEEDQKFLDRVQASAKTVRNWDADTELLEKCRSLVPLEELLGSSSIINDDKEEKPPYCNAETDRLLRSSGSCFGNVAGGSDSNALFLQRLCRWFQSYMSWMNNPPCKKCGFKDTEMKTVRAAETAEEIEGLAKRVEVYYCSACDDNTTTFPRYNKAAKLLETRQGRCGEYANLFGLFCRSVGFETRLVLDWSDHLWTEVRLGDSWVMADACEGVIDKPSMYEHGWGKDGLCYMVGIGRDHVVDVTPRYTRKFMSDDFQTRRRAHTSSEDTSERILQQFNEWMKTHPTNMTKSRMEELERRRKLEDAELRHYKQATEWTEQEKYGSGRISGSLAWRRSRQEAGSANNATSTESKNATSGSLDHLEVAGFPAEAFVPARLKRRKMSFCLNAVPKSRHDGILVSDTPCAVGVTNSVSVVVVDNNDKSLGCILQSKSFVEWDRVAEFVNDLPSGRIVLMNGKIEIGNKTKPEDFYKAVDIPRLSNWNGNEVAKQGVLFAGQVDSEPDWAFCESLEATINSQNNGLSDTYEVEIDAKNSGDEVIRIQDGYKLRTERALFPQRVAGRLPEAFMPFTRQVGSASEKEKREAYLKFAESHGGRYCGYTTKKDSPVYLLDSTAYPLQSELIDTDMTGESSHTWNTFLELPDPLVSSTDHGIEDVTNDGLSTPIYDVPLDSAVFNSLLGPNLLSNTSLRKETSDALTNARLIGLYFSAHWCGPCRNFTPMLAEMYEHLRETYPTHGLEIVFVSGDRDEQSFRNYYETMPWKAIPFDQLQLVSQSLNITFGVRGIPSFVILDAVSGQVVIPANESRQEIVTACRGGDLRIEAMFQSWLSRTPSSTQELLSMIELSAREVETSKDDGSEKSLNDNPYLKRTIDTSTTVDNKDFETWFKAEFEKLVQAGHHPNTAAAKALEIVSETSKEKSAAKAIPGGIDLKASYKGSSRLGSQDTTADALAYAIEQNSASAVAETLSIAHKYVVNSQRIPWEPKFRRFKLSNKVADKITRVEGGLGLIQSIGFEIVGTNRDFEASIPAAANLKSMDTKIAQLIDDLEKASVK